MKYILCLLTILVFCYNLVFADTSKIHKNKPEQVLKGLGIALATPSSPVASYVNAVRVGNLVYLSGKGPELSNGGIMKGKVGKNLSIIDAKKAARLTAITLLSVLKNEIDDLSKVKRIVKLNGFVNSTPSFKNHPEVINGASDLLVKVFGDDVGRHTRVAVGVNSLPFNIPVEIDLVVEIEN